MSTIDHSILKIIKDYPKPGINFIDINPLLSDPVVFQKVITLFIEQISATLNEIVCTQVAVITPEARGFIFAAPVAYKLGLPLLLIRKKGKIPNNPYSFRITNEYDSYDMEIDSDLLSRYQHFIYIDDILATGQTTSSVRKALQAKGKDIVLSLHLTEVATLKNVRATQSLLKDLKMEVIL